MTDIRTAPLKMTLEDGDTYIDVPAPPHRSARSVNVDVVKPKPLAASVQEIFGRGVPEAITLRTTRQPLRWMKPGPDGKLVPR